MSFAFDFARHFFQPRGIGRARDQSAQLGGNRRFPRWLSLRLACSSGLRRRRKVWEGMFLRRFVTGFPVFSRNAQATVRLPGSFASRARRGYRKRRLTGGEEAPPNCRTWSLEMGPTGSDGRAHAVAQLSELSQGSTALACTLRCAGRNTRTDLAYYRQPFRRPTFDACRSRHKLPIPLRTSRF